MLEEEKGEEETKEGKEEETETSATPAADIDLDWEEKLCQSNKVIAFLGFTFGNSLNLSLAHLARWTLEQVLKQDQEILCHEYPNCVQNIYLAYFGWATLKTAAPVSKQAICG